MSTWRSIETAPEDGRAFLAVDQFGQQWLCVRNDKGIVGIGQNYIWMAEQVAQHATHWMPLPEPPHYGSVTRGLSIDAM